MDPWVLSDGTKVHLGGLVEGDSFDARQIRSLIKESKTGNISSNFGACPHYERLDANVPYLLDAFVRCWGNVTSAPAIETPDVTPRPPPPRGAVY